MSYYTLYRFINIIRGEYIYSRFSRYTCSRTMKEKDDQMMYAHTKNIRRIIKEQATLDIDRRKDRYT